MKVLENFLSNGVSGQKGQTLSDEDVKKIGPQMEELKKQGLVGEDDSKAQAQSGPTSEVPKEQHAPLQAGQPNPVAGAAAQQQQMEESKKKHK